MNRLPEISSVADIRYGQNPILDAWLLHFKTENNLEYLLYPRNASPEQLRFMVVLEEGQAFVPCSDELFRNLIKPELTDGLRRAYSTVWRVLIRMVRANIDDPYLRARIIQFCRHRFRLALSSHITIPSRLMKRLSGIFLTQSGIEDPYRERKMRYNRRVHELMQTTFYDRVLNTCPEERPACRRLDDLRWDLDMIQLHRLLVLSTWPELWHSEGSAPTLTPIAHELNEPGAPLGVCRAFFGPERSQPANVLYLVNSSGGIMLDLMIIRQLLRLGHRVMLALKSGFYFQSPTVWDVDSDPVLARELHGAHYVHDDAITKNALLQALREHRFVILSDGTQERCNLYRVSVTFARAWKEADVVIAKDEPHYRRLIMTDHLFTRDILCWHRDRQGRFRFDYKARPKGVHKFTETDLRAMSDRIIAQMRAAKASGKNVMFYSAIVGSVPGQTKVAIDILHTFVAHLRAMLAETFIINPAEHFEEGMDGDDLMYMWERVQRSGLIDVWRFQSVDDIEKSFALMDKTVPPVWAGKDATFSTGCTKEMHIAVDVQRRHPEMQLIGPSPEKFFRRREYGVGKYFDAGIVA
ncbi:MAG: ARMT1-like domain-containing protein [Desulfovibrionaceae bacterium]